MDDLRAEWKRLIGERLPAVAGKRRWPIRFDHCFARVLLDNHFDRPWREAIPAPAWRHLSEADLRALLAAGEAVLAGEADLPALNRRSLDLRGKRGPATARPQASFGSKVKSR